MRIFVALIFFLFLFSFGHSQSVYDVVDSVNVDIKKRIDFLREYYTQEKDYKSYWHPKYKDIENYQFGTNIETFVRMYSPKVTNNALDLQIREICLLNDSLSYVKLKGFYDKQHIITYKYYIADIDGKLYLDNCLEYESKRFNHIKTDYIDFYISKWYDFTEEDCLQAAREYDDLYDLLKPPVPKKRMKNFVCASPEEMNILANMEEYYGYVGGFANSECNFIVAHKKEVFYKHEFVHAILGSPASGKCWHLSEGMATRFGGFRESDDFDYCLQYLREGYASGRFNFDDLYHRKISNPTDNAPTYSFAALLCEYILQKWGMDTLREMYYNPEITDDNLLSILENKANLDKEGLIRQIEALIR